MHYVKSLGFYLLVAFIILIAVFPFYYAIITSLKSGTALFQVDYWPSSFSLENYIGVVRQGSFLRILGHSLLVATVVVAISLLLAVTAAYALARVNFRGRGLLLLTILSVSMFPQIAVLAGLFELIRFLGIFNTPLALIFSYMIFTLPFTVWVLTTFMRDLPVEIEEAANLIRQAADPEANIFFGADTDDSLEDEVRITVIATGFDGIKRPKAPEVREEIHMPDDMDEKGFIPIRPERKEPVVGTLQDTGNDLDIPPFLRRKKVKRDF